MTGQENKGFKVVDKRSMPDEEREKSSPPPPPPQPQAQAEGGNRNAPEGVMDRKSPGDKPSDVGGPAFLDLVSTLQFGAMASLGMIQSPDGKRFPVNLPSAKDSIDILGILQEKTKGNLTTEEAEVLTEGLYHLRMAYTAAMNAGQGAGGKGK
jgi:hypothetical protein